MNPAFLSSPFAPEFSPTLEKVGEMLHPTVNAADTRGTCIESKPGRCRNRAYGVATGFDTLARASAICDVCVTTEPPKTTACGSVFVQRDPAG